MYIYINIYWEKNLKFSFNLIKRTLRSFTFFFMRDLQFLYDLWNQIESSVLLCSFIKNATFFYKERKRKQRMFRSLLKNGKERKERSVLLERTGKNAKNAAFFYKERKKTQRTPHSFIKYGKDANNAAFFYKEPKRTQERCFLLKRTDAQPRSFGLYGVFAVSLFYCNNVNNLTYSMKSTYRPPNLDYPLKDCTAIELVLKLLILINLDAHSS